MTRDMEIAKAVVEARESWTALPTFPGPLPETVAEAYRAQDQAIALANAPAPGWKIAAITPGKNFGLPIDRFCGPARLVRLATAAEPIVRPALIEDGFAAVEAEIVIRLARAFVATDGVPDPSALFDYVDTLHLGSEIAGSPIHEIIALGPIGAICDHGNCLEVAVGSPIGRDVLTRPDIFEVEVTIDGQTVGKGTPAAIPGGIRAALDFMFRNLADRGIDLASGTWISTGALTGVHPVLPGQKASVRFGDYPPLHIAPVAGQR